jgi:hypothetical protein
VAYPPNQSKWFKLLAIYPSQLEVIVKTLRGTLSGSNLASGVRSGWMFESEGGTSLAVCTFLETRHAFLIIRGVVE